MFSFLSVMATIVAAHSSPSSPPIGPDGSELLRSCGAAVRLADGAKLQAEDDARAVWCIGYVSGMLDALAVMNWKGGSARVCLPANGLENNQAIRIIVKYLREHPEQLHESGRVSVVAAIGGAFLCK